MWKCISRGLRETFERRVNFTRKDKTTGQECSTGLQNKFIPCLVSSHLFDNGTNNVGGGRHKNGPCNDKKQHNREHHGEKWSKEHFHIQQSTIVGALGWSGVMVLGWYLCHPVCRHRKIKPHLDRYRNQANISRCHTDYVSLFGLVSRIASAQPLSVLPKKSINHVPTKNSLLSDPFVMVSVDETDSFQEPETETPFGPITGEEAINEAAADLEKTHQKVMREIDHRIGMACMQLGKHKEAMTHFQKAVELDYAPAAFNLGLCYETGVGTAQDLKLAAKYYELASKLGHATAMYNLGVFHVRGWGGVQIDSNKARDLFVAAAKLGQTNAIEALAMVPAPEQETEKIVHNEDTRVSSKSVAEKRRDSVAYKTTDLQNGLDPTRKFYQFLGIKNPEIIEDGYNVNNSLLNNSSIIPMPILC